MMRLTCFELGVLRCQYESDVSKVQIGLLISTCPTHFSKVQKPVQECTLICRRAGRLGLIARLRNLVEPTRSRVTNSGIQMYCLKIIIVALPTAGLLAAIDTVLADEATAETCRVCHQGPLRLQSADSNNFRERIRAAIAGETPHPAALPALSDDEITALAEALLAE